MNLELTPEQELFLTQWDQKDWKGQRDCALRMFTDNMKMGEYLAAQTIELQKVRSQMVHYESLLQKQAAAAAAAATRSPSLPKEDFNL